MGHIDFMGHDYYGNQREELPTDADLNNLASEEAARFRFEQRREAANVIADMSADIWPDITDARAEAHLKHGDQSMEGEPADSPRWLAILGEEFGEVCRALTYDGTGNLRDELIDVLAVASAWVTAIDNERDKGFEL